MDARVPSTTDLLAEQARESAKLDLRALFDSDPQRFERMSFSFGPVLLDLSRQRLSARSLASLLDAAQQRSLPAAIKALLGGEALNLSEARPALHTALRSDPDSPTSDTPQASEAAEIAHESLARMLAIAEAVRSGEGSRFGLKRVTDLVSVGIGGSELGPKLALQALAHRFELPVRVHFLANADGAAADRLLRRLDPRHTMACVISKSFTTEETRLNAALLRRWFSDQYHSVDRAADGASAARHFLAVTANTAAAEAVGIDRSRILPMWDWVGGRYSLWSAVGLPIAVAIGSAGFRELLAGAAEMDRHFRDSPMGQNLPVLLGLTDYWNASHLGYAARAVTPYDERLAELPAFLQQLEMESNGKGVGRGGEPLTERSAPVVWGGVGTNAQHAFFQALHQGTDVVPVEFIAAIRPDHAFPGSHQVLLANMLAQSQALMSGRSCDQLMAELRDKISDPERRLALARQRSFSGNRPSTTILLDELAPRTLGMLLALYEHKVFVQGWMLGINSFDQWGVELGKQLARELLPSFDDDSADDSLDPATRGLLGHIRQRRNGD